MDSVLHEYDNSIILIAREPIEGRQALGPFAREHNVDPESLYNESEDYNKELFTGKLIYRVIDENGQPFTEGNVQIYNVDTKEYKYFDSKEDFYDNYDFLGKKMIEWRPHKVVLPIVNLTTYLYFRPLVNYDCNFTYKGDWYVLAGIDARNVDYIPNYSVLVNSVLGNEIEKPPRPEDVFRTPLELLQNYVMLDGTILWDVKEETVFKWYREVFTENDCNDFYLEYFW